MVTAVFGGAFDPVHTEHVALAKAAAEELNLTKLILTPTVVPPHKEGAEAGFEHRANMLEIAFRGFPAEVIISDVERTGEGKNYTAEVIPKLKKLYGDFFYLIGGDSLVHFESWFNFKEIFKNVKIAAFDREGFPDCAAAKERYRKLYGADITLLKYKGKEVSSSLLKAELYLEEEVDLLPAGVDDYIRQNDLYSKYRPMTEKVKGLCGLRKFNHSKNVVKEALKINSLHNLKLPFDDVFTAALLHDIGYSEVSEGVPEAARGTAVAHQFSGAVLAKRLFNVENADVLNAVTYHCTGRADMSALEKLIYTADMISPERDFPFVDKLRAAVYNDFNGGFIDCINTAYRFLSKKGVAVYPLTIEAYNYYNNQNL